MNILHMLLAVWLLMLSFSAHAQHGITVNLGPEGTYRDRETGLLYNEARYYDPKTGRFITADPRSIERHVQRWQANLGNIPNQPPLELNPYVRVANNPQRWTDPTGENIAVVIGVVTVCVGGTLYLAYEYLRPILQTSAQDRLDAMNDIVGGVPGAQQRYDQASARLGAAAGAAGATGALAMPPPGSHRGIGVAGGRAAGKIAGETYIELKEKIGECNGQCPTPR